MRHYLKKTILLLIIVLSVSNIGAYIPAYGWGESYKVDIKVELRKMEVICESSNATNEEIITQYNNISKIVAEHCSDKEIEELDKLFNNFLDNKNEGNLKAYIDKTTEFVAGKPNFIMFFAIVIALIIGLFIIPIRKVSNKM